MLEERKGEFRHLFREFAQSHFDTPDGRRDVGMYSRGRQQAQENVREILQARDRGEDITDLVLLKLLPYTDTAPNRSKGAWVSIAPAVTGDVRAWLQNVGFTKAKDWPRVAEAILQFVLRCIEDPAELSSACAEFSELSYSKGFQSGMLTPILNALRPDDYALINNKPRQVVNHFSGTDYGQPLLDYPTLNQAFQQLVGDLAEDMHRLDVPEMRDGDLFDAFCHWLVAVKKYEFGPRYWKMAPGADAWNWEACRDGGFMAMGWDDLGDISDLNREEFEAKRDEVAQSREDWSPYGANQVWTFAREMKVGDRIVANKGTTQVLGIGTVAGEYYYVPGARHGHRRSVHWDDQARRRVNEGGWRRTMVELDKGKFEAISGAPPIETAFTQEHIEALLSLVRRAFPTWAGLSDPRFIEAEVAYKRDAIEKARELLSEAELQRLIESENHEEVIRRLEALAHATNLLWLAAPRSGDLNILYEPSLDKPSFSEAVQELLYGSGLPEDRLRRYLQYLESKGLPSKWTFPTYLLFLCHPDTEMFVKPTVTKWLLGRTGKATLWQSKPNPDTYAAIKRMAGELREQLAEYRPQDMVDIQSFVYTCYLADTKPPDTHFTSEAFELLSQLHETPRLQFYSDHREDFMEHQQGPFKQLLADVSAQLPPTITEMMETEKRVFARIPKNDYGRGGAWDYYWGAFYPKGGKRTADAQLLVWMNRDVLQFGFYIGDYGQEPRQRFWRNLQAHRAALTDILGETLSDPGFQYGDEEENEQYYRTWVRALKPVPRAVVNLGRDTVLGYSKEELGTEIAQAFSALFPFVLLATLDEPLLAIEGYLVPEPDVDDVQPVYALDDCATDTGFDRADLELWLAAIEHKRQAILYGPPGTGKTYLAKQLARHIVGGSDGFWEVVQFHPAYAYEDFVQGIRPQSGGDGQLDYPVLPGRFLRFCSKAAGRRGRYVLIIDEINRANLARVFGELMYLLEYRDETVALAVDGRSFSIPENVRLIGTMNTADRSIALVDHALRRRFAFIGLWPNYGVLRSWHEKETGFNTDGLIAVLERLNREIGDPNYHVGISFFLVQNPTALFEGIWRMEIEPYLEEYFFDQRETVHQFRWDEVKGEVLGQ